MNLKESLEMRFFITSLTDAGKACEAMRSHWGVENGLHWELLYSFWRGFVPIAKR